MDDIPRIVPKSVQDTYEGHRYEVRFDVHAEPERRWFWVVHFTRVYDMMGGGPSLSAATNMARRAIREMKKHVG